MTKNVVYLSAFVSFQCHKWHQTPPLDFVTHQPLRVTWTDHKSLNMHTCTFSALLFMLFKFQVLTVSFLSSVFLCVFFLPCYVKHPVMFIPLHVCFCSCAYKCFLFSRSLCGAVFYFIKKFCICILLHSLILTET